MNFVLQKYATDDTFAETESAIMRFVQLVEMNPSQYAKECDEKIFHYGDMFGEYELNEIFF